MQRILFILALMVLGKASSGARRRAAVAQAGLSPATRRRIQGYYNRAGDTWAQAERNVSNAISGAERRRLNTARRRAGLGALPRRGRR